MRPVISESFNASEPEQLLTIALPAAEAPANGGAWNQLSPFTGASGEDVRGPVCDSDVENLFPGLID